MTTTMSLQLGIVGLPNVGKSSLFSALTKKHVAAENYAFTTIDPNVGVVDVPDERLQKLAKVSASKKIIPVTIEFVDIAGLVKGAHKGEGLGNKFLSNIREVDAIVHVVRAFENRDVTHVHGNVDPTRDYDIIATELALADLATVDKMLGGVEGKARSGGKEAAAMLTLLSKLKNGLQTGLPARSIEIPEEQRDMLKTIPLLTLKPELVVWNVDEKNMHTAPPEIVPISAKIEAELADLPENETSVYLKDLGWESSGLNRLIKASYSLLHLISFFATGPQETRAWSIRKGSTAPQAAGKIHTDFENGFIKMEVINWKDFIDAGGETAAKSQGKMHLEGKNYFIQDGDVVYVHAKA